ncbi:trypsin-2-like [Bombus vosnesenskii]|uniref:Trypsin-2-like n=1 Tax=Bombus vosnesenskii TaxID=207650 RepID=A0A6J3KA94_9HYME|nr:trypsin-2-like [Bombus vosnesenskii]
MLRIVLLAAFIVGCLGSVPKPLSLFPDPRIIGGSQVDIGQHPHQLSLQTSGHICGGSIISSNWAITAAHCVGSSPSQYTIRIGSSHKDLGTPYGIKNIIRHPRYNARTIDFDVALLEINGTVEFGTNVQPIKPANTELLPNKMVNVTGWGALTEGGSTSARLMRVSVPIVSKSECADAYRYMNKITDRMICAGYTSGGKDACQGDSGGPLTADGFLYGLVSWGYGCAKPKYPGVYTNVANLRSWIKTHSGV